MLVNTQFTYKKSLLVLLSCVALALAGCSGSAGDAPNGSGSGSGGSGSGSGESGGGSGGGTTVTTPGTASVLLSSTSLTSTTPITVSATIKNADGTAVANEVVSFSVPDTYGSFSASSNQTSFTALTNASGVATAVLYVGSISGAASVTATSTAKDSEGKEQAVAARTSFSVTAPGQAVNTITMGALSTGVAAGGSLSAYGTTSVTVTVMNNGVAYTTPVEVSFNSICAGTGKAALTPKVTTIEGVATASYVDKGCASVDVISASVAGVTAVPATTNLTVQSPRIGSIQFVSAQPNNIVLKGTGGAGSSESALVKFKVVDQAGAPIKADVTFALSTSIGGLSLASTSATSDPVTGIAEVYVNSGTVATSVRVTASYTAPDGTQISSQSDQLTVSSGLPDQAHFSLSTTAANIEGWGYDNEKATLTILAADHFSNKVPDGTSVSFIAEGAAVQSRCETQNGGCSVVFNSQNARPKNGRISVLAYAVGEEAFSDANGNGVFDQAVEFRDSTGRFSDMAEAFVDYNENGAINLTATTTNQPVEPYLDFNSDAMFSAADGKLNAGLCPLPPAAPYALCNYINKTIHVREQLVMVLSGSFASFYAASAASTIDYVATSNPDLANPFTPTPPPAFIDLEGCVEGASKSKVLSLLIVDHNQNPMPAGTTIAASVVDNGKLLAPDAPYIVGSTADGRSQVYRFILGDDSSTSNGVCTDNKRSGFLKIKVTTPKNNITDYLIPLIN